MQCPRCQHENPPKAKFCEECAAPLARTCSNCGTQLSPTAKFCPECAHPVAGGPAEPRFASPESYTPKHLAEKILTSKAALEGERKQVTVLFADLKGSMELLADRDPEEARKLLDPVLEHMMEAVHRYEGTVNQVMGDGIMALFGAPLAHEDHAVRACYAALRMQESVKKYAEEVRRAHAAVVKIRVGLNSGEVVVRAIGNDLRMDYTAVGQTTHLAARMEQIAEPGAIVITPDTLTLAEGYVEVKSLGPVPVKGLAGAVEIYEVIGAGIARTRLQASARRGLTRFVGRGAELEQLRHAQQLAGHGRGQVAAIVGEAGVGKSRLVYEFTHSHRLQGWLVLESTSVSYGKATSYWPVVDLLRGYFKIQDRDDLREIREKVTGKLLTLDEALKPTLPALLALLDVPVEDVVWQTLDPAGRRQRTLDAVRQLLLREAREQPLLVIFEDLHWIDSETQAFLDMLIDSLGSVRLLLLVNYRPEYQHGWGSKTSYSQMRLDALAAESARELLDALLGDNLELVPLKQLLVKRGNPFFLEETVRTLVETKALTGERGRYRLTQPLPAIQVPSTVQAMLAARIDRLPSEDKRLLQTAAVVGKDVPFAVLQAIADLPDGPLRRGLDHLQAAEFLYETGLFPDLEYAFKHALTHEVVYGGVLHDRRRALHVKIVEALEVLHRDRLVEQVERLGHHAVRGEVWDKAVTYLRQAGVKAASRSVHHAAIAHFEQALSALTHLPDTRPTLEQAIDLRFELRGSLFSLGELERLGTCLHEAQRVATTLDDQPRLSQVSAFLSHYFLITGRPDKARMFAESARATGENTRDRASQVWATFYLGLARHASGDYRGAEDLLRAVARSPEAELIHRRQNVDAIATRSGRAAFPAAWGHDWLAQTLAERGEFAEGVAHGREAIRIAEGADYQYWIIAATWRLAYLHNVKGDFADAVALLERGVMLAREWSEAFWFAYMTSSLGYAYAHLGRAVEGASLLEEAVKTLESMRFASLHSLFVTHLGEATMLARRLLEARGFAGRALTLACDRGERGWKAWALRLLGEIASRSDPSDVGTAQDHYGRAMALATELGMRPLIAHCHLGFGKLYRHVGKQQEAHEHLGTAMTLYRAMDMRFWLEQAEAETKERR
jgi:class 3 adenylate cyclase/tetratricopeptide (TPR) repeat protein